MKQIIAALIKVQTELKPALKSSENTFFKVGNKASKYADLTAIWDACRAPLVANELCVVQTTDFDEHGAWLKTTLLHSSGESIEGRFPLRPTKPDMQGMGSALTYARRYGLAAIVGVVSDEDDDGNAASAPPTSTRSEHPAYTPQGASTVSPDRKAAAKKWANDQLAIIPTLKASEFTAWHKKNANGIAATRDVNETLHRTLHDAVLKRQLELSAEQTGAPNGH